MRIVIPWLTILAFVAPALTSSASPAKQIHAAFELDGSSTVELSADVGTSALEFFVVLKDPSTALEGSLFQTAGGLAVPAKKSEVLCTKVSTGEGVAFWKVALTLPKNDKPVRFAVALEEFIDGRSVGGGKFYLQMLESPKTNPETNP